MILLFVPDLEQGGGFNKSRAEGAKFFGTFIKAPFILKPPPLFVPDFNKGGALIETIGLISRFRHSKNTKTFRDYGYQTPKISHCPGC